MVGFIKIIKKRIGKEVIKKFSGLANEVGPY